MPVRALVRNPAKAAALTEAGAEIAVGDLAAPPAIDEAMAGKASGKASGKLARRPELDRALLVARAADQLVVTKLDRLGRSLEHLIDLSKGLQARGVDLMMLDHRASTPPPR